MFIGLYSLMVVALWVENVVIACFFKKDEFFLKNG